MSSLSVTENFQQSSFTFDNEPSLTARLVVDTDGRIVAMNRAVHGLFNGLFQRCRSVFECLEEGEKLGLLQAGTRSAIAEAFASKRPSHLFEMRDGRSVLLALDAADNGFVGLEFTDVSYVVQTALSRQRDVLTGLPNRLELLQRLEEQDRSLAASSRRALLYIDLDRFKIVNDTLGHPIGDALLKLVADRMSRLLGDGDLLARLGGDEFAILQAGGEQPAAAENLASKIIEIVGRTYLIQGHSVQVGASVGIALASTDGRTPEELIKNADIALFKAKSGGRSTFRFFTDAMDEEIRARRALEIDLRRALVMQEFSVVYQPQFQIAGKKLVGFEALVRWFTPERGHVSPADFIPLAEEIGIIEALGEWVLRTACHEAAKWPDPLTVSVNLSPLQFKSGNLINTIMSELANAGLPPSRLDLEITEGALMAETDAVIATLRQIKELGIKVSMDDFGTGYSSLSYLQKFPFDKIKIDQSFIRRLETCADNAAIVRAVTALGESLGIMTIAEGVETESQLLQIAADGCRQVQGYLTGRPVPAAEMAAFFQNQS